MRKRYPEKMHQNFLELKVDIIGHLKRLLLNSKQSLIFFAYFQGGLVKIHEMCAKSPTEWPQCQL